MLVNAALVQHSNNANGPDCAIEETSVDRDPSGPANTPFEHERPW